jgi:hypothetical protein
MTKKLLFVLMTGAVAHFSGKAAVTLLDAQTEQVIPNGTVYQVWGDVTESLINWHGIDVVNNTGNTTKINMKRYTLNAQPSVEDYFCWYVCLGSVNSTSNPELNHSAGACFNSNDGDTLTYFSNYYKPMGLTGSATYRYVWFNASSPNDSAYADVTFNITPLSVSEFNKEISLSMFPNPASDRVNISLENVDNSGNLRLEIVDIIGNKILSQSISGTNAGLDLSEFDNGIYFCTIVSDKKAILTKRFVVSH